MEPQITVTNHEVHITLSGGIYVAESARLREQLFLYLDSGYKKFVIDMHGVDYIDSSGLGVFVAIHKRALQNGGGIILRGLNGSVKELFVLTRLNKVFEIQE